jgi:hypothetical protein
MACANPGNLRGLRVLCVDNDGAILDGMQALLGQWGVHVLKARNSAEATVLCDQSGVDTVLADYHLGDGVDGIENVSIRPKSMVGGASGNSGSIRVEYRFGAGDAAEEMGYYNADEEWRAF